MNKAIFEDLIDKACDDAMRDIQNAARLLPEDDDDPPEIATVVFFTAVLMRLTTSFVFMVSEHGLGSVSINKALTGYIEVLKDFVKESMGAPDKIEKLKKALHGGTKH